MNQQQHRDQLHLIHKAQFYKGVAIGYPTIQNITFALDTYLTEDGNAQEAQNIRDYFNKFTAEEIAALIKKNNYSRGIK